MFYVSLWFSNLHVNENRLPFHHYFWFDLQRFDSFGGLAVMAEQLSSDAVGLVFEFAPRRVI